jgi:hypothetical protein
MKRIRALVLHASAPENETLSYQRAWPRHFARHPAFDCTTVDVLDRRQNRLTRLRARVGGRRLDAVVILHSVFSNGRYLDGRLLDAVRRLAVPKAYFIGNEYKGMPEKMWFCETLAVDLLVSQFTTEPPLRLYRERLGCAVVGIPNTGWDAELFACRVAPEEREVDVGYRAYENDLALGHDERRQLADRFREAVVERGLRADISLDRRERFDERGWAAFLNRCRGQLGSEAGGDYFELTDETRQAVLAYSAAHPGATVADVRSRFFRDYGDATPGRALSGRHVEAAGTKTTQILLEGEYGGYLRPDVHFIPVRKDFSNVHEALDKLADAAYTRELRERAFAVAQELTYERLIDRFRDALAPFL